MLRNIKRSWDTCISEFAVNEIWWSTDRQWSFLFMQSFTDKKMGGGFRLKQSQQTANKQPIHSSPGSMSHDNETSHMTVTSESHGTKMSHDNGSSGSYDTNDGHMTMMSSLPSCEPSISSLSRSI